MTFLFNIISELAMPKVSWKTKDTESNILLHPMNNKSGQKETEWHQMYKRHF